MKLSHTPVETIHIWLHKVYVKRDDLLHPEFSGNKARKFAYFLENDFPSVRRLIGYGSPQANSLYSLSALAKLKGWQLDYYVDHLPSYLTGHPSGNYRAALANGANIIDLSNVVDRDGLDCEGYIRQRVLTGSDEQLFVPEGGRCAFAEPGVSRLANEIAGWKVAEQLSELVVFLPSGTGTTALYLQKQFQTIDPSISVMTCAVVGGNDYLTKQFFELEQDESLHPHIVPAVKRYHFGKLYHDFYQIWHELKSTGIEFELLYDPLGWLCLKHLWQQGLDAPVLYLHQGGLLGNESMLPRYRRKFGELIPITVSE
ncbi:1-aminocyclopropane-1-carboxylate deaminase/D-cysteine desulfhydrase [Shewanella insulae]|uniref:1-aminocyclopropane-1-carboxylate deaminase/D-cysteine desulfhydrase n=1 Tax=Shewanella insulae TaxID=2681496 RepID=UPI001EFD1943|nr:1-aminocyclopropane-1-carboxylate deaminase/D-cysteine desulfhydrase [Shewanella insulae]MCG9736846.1 1-aminocyclopropane-1-carboxylate deaminase/D-cysteine desulfhydrase [Shewanella insulae]MCG9756482.1 1-aminocyclopropane-1-carboxylate deaminase/D-cysteine desulfhydrase [Shewanella insulae]